MESLPREIVVIIFFYLDPIDWKSISLCSKSFLSILNSMLRLKYPDWNPEYLARPIQFYQLANLHVDKESTCILTKIVHVLGRQFEESCFIIHTSKVYHFIYTNFEFKVYTNSQGKKNSMSCIPVGIFHFLEDLDKSFDIVFSKNNLYCYSYRSRKPLCIKTRPHIGIKWSRYFFLCKIQDKDQIHAFMLCTEKIIKERKQFHIQIDLGNVEIQGYGLFKGIIPILERVRPLFYWRNRSYQENWTKFQLFEYIDEKDIEYIKFGTYTFRTTASIKVKCRNIAFYF